MYRRILFKKDINASHHLHNTSHELSSPGLSTSYPFSHPYDPNVGADIISTWQRSVITCPRSPSDSTAGPGANLTLKLISQNWEAGGRQTKFLTWVWGGKQKYIQGWKSLYFAPYASALLGYCENACYVYNLEKTGRPTSETPPLSQELSLNKPFPLLLKKKKKKLSAKVLVQKNKQKYKINSWALNFDSNIFPTSDW